MEEEFRDKVAKHVAEGGWSSIRDFVDLVPIEDLECEFYYLLEDEDGDDDVN